MKGFYKVLGPGLIFASTAIGVSHLVQSTRAGMMYGFGFLMPIILINLLKFPFFEYGTRYAAATGKSLIDGYRKLGIWAIAAYFLVMLISLFFVSAAVFQVTAVFMEELFRFKQWTDLSWLPLVLTVMICFLILAFGRFKALDQVIKVVGLVMIGCTAIAFLMVLWKGPVSIEPGFEEPSLWVVSTIPFAIALMGWMPTAVDLSTWNSLWTLEKRKTSGYHSTVKEAVREFSLGYWISAALAVMFLTLGAYLVYGTSIPVMGGSGGFANQVISLFTESMGAWSYYLIAVAAFCIMFGTSIGVLDGYSRAFQRSWEVAFRNGNSLGDRFYLSALLMTALGAFLLCWLLKDQPKGFLLIVDIATILSFLFAPVVAVLNYILVTRKDFPAAAQPKLWMKLLSVVGIVVLSLLSLVYVAYYFGGFD
ncbi:NRAMP family divalent metal transporter [Nonlabens xiamenensis]|uniref:NRAMP family divalent metal transporter n=1 Tax=Nonlabens xiamenensis TaxID=2341043 RepID=UPI000F60F287|nr:divalent metal cation transporter [Nonlabens xiamenensis]